MGIIREDEEPAPLISVIVPALNSARTIERCLRALGGQATSQRFEVLVVHSGEDDTCARAAAALPGTRTIQLHRRTLAAGARNAGVAAARGEILAFLDSDVYADARWLDTVPEAVRPGFDLACGSIENANPRSAVSRAEQLLMFNEFLPELPGGPIWFALSGNTILPRAAYERYGPFVEVRAAEDVVFSRRLVAAGGRILFVPELRVYHDNRQRLGPFLRNQVTLGRHTAIARRLVRFADSRSLLPFYLLLPVAPFAKLAKIALRFARRRPALLGRLMRELPLVGVGLAAYGMGQVGGGWARLPAIATDPAEGLRSPKKRMPIAAGLRR
ncbi:MAG TPA: glycosyltransferase [Candidatus Binatia bacterium]|nr:glycosyltransferase [Candidatus Binatia bacterium]